MNVPTISPQQLLEKMKSGATVTLIDVRTPVEYREVHAVGTFNMPLDTLKPETLIKNLPDANEPIYMICRSGGRAGQACERMIAAGLENVVNVEGGTTAWESAGLPVVRDHRIISLERQVRITAGSLVLLGTLLGFFVHPYWLAIPAFVGTGLVFAGISNTCGMGLLLARMPWNRNISTTEASCPMSHHKNDKKEERP